MKRKLISLYKNNEWNEGGKYLVHFAYYEHDPETERLEFNGISEEALLTEEEFYNLLKPALKRETRPTRKERRDEG